MTDLPTTPDPIEIAMEAEASGVAPVGPAARLLQEQAALIHQQLLAQRIGNLLRLGAGVLGLALVAIVGVVVWQASRADGLIIKPFSVPPELAQRGVTGEAVASQLLDKVSVITDRAWSSTRQHRVTADRDESIAIEIPETGVSISQLEQWLREKLGHQTRLTGELMLDPEGRLVLAARVGPSVLPTQTGAPGELDAMLQRAAEAIATQNDPRTYSVYLFRMGRLVEMEALARTQIQAADPDQRAWGYAQLGFVHQGRGDNFAARHAFYRSLALAPDDSAMALNNLSIIEVNLGHAETALRLTRRLIALTRARRDMAAKDREDSALLEEARLDDYLGDHAREVEIAQSLRRRQVRGYDTGASVSLLPLIYGLAALHEPTAARAELEDTSLAASKTGYDMMTRISAQSEDWPAVLANAEKSVEGDAAAPDGGRANTATPCLYTAPALAHLGRISEAEALLASQPADSAFCAGAHGVVAAVRGDVGQSERWFAQAVRMAPSWSGASLEWGRARLARGDAAGAIQAFALSHRTSPQFADPLEGWGEALLAKGEAAGAGLQFAAAAKVAPRWGRMHVKWGEALAKLGKADAARAQWKLAAGLDLTAEERAQLARLMR